MRLLRAAWKSLVILGLVAFVASTFLLARQLKGLLTEATPTGSGGPASVDGLLNGLADTMDGVAQGIGAGSANPIQKSADQLRSLQRDIGGSQRGMDELSAGLDRALGGAAPLAPAQATSRPQVNVPVRKPATEKPAAAGSAAQGSPPHKAAPHRPTRIE
jgi:hypothetical protein